MKKLCYLLSLFIGSCTLQCEEQYFYLEDGASDWTNYRSGDTLIFATDSGVTATFVYGLVFPGNEFEFEQTDCDYDYFEYSYAEISEINKPEKFVGEFYIKQYYDDLRVRASWYGVSEYIENLANPVGMTIAGKSYSEVYTAEADTTGLFNNQVARFMFNKKDGVLKYELMSGAKFNLQN